MNNRKLQTAQELRIDFLLNNRELYLIQNCELLIELMNFSLINFFGPMFNEAIIRPAIKFFWKEQFFHKTVSQRYLDFKVAQSTFETEFIQKHCPNIDRQGDPFFRCLNGVMKGIHNPQAIIEYRKELVDMMGKTAWFSNNLEACNVIFDSELKKQLFITAELQKIENFWENSQEEIKNLLEDFKKLRTDMIAYATDSELTYQVNRRNFQGWSIERHKDKLHINDKTSTLDFIRKYKAFFNPLGSLLELFLLGGPTFLIKKFLIDNYFRISLYYFVQDRYLDPKLRNLNDENEKKYLDQKKLLLVKHKDKFLKLEEETMRLREQTIRANRVKNALISGFLLWTVISIIYEYFSKPWEEKDFITYDAIIFLYSSFSLIYFMHQQWKSIAIDSVINNHKNFLKTTIQKVKGGEIEVYKGRNLQNSLFFLPLQSYKRLSADKVARVLSYNFGKHGYSSSYPEGHQLAIKVNKNVQIKSLQQDLEQTLKIENQRKKLKDQIMQLASIMRAVVEMVNLEVAGQMMAMAKAHFSFAREEQAHAWKTFLEQKLQVTIIQNNYQLSLRVPLQKEHAFQMFKQACKSQARLQLNLMPTCLSAERSQLLSNSKDKEREEYYPSRVKKEKIKTRPVKPAKNINQKKHVPLPRVSRHNIFTIKNPLSESLKYPRCFKMSLTADDLGVTKEEYKIIIQKIESGDIALDLLQGSILDENVRALHENKSFLPDAKVRLRGVESEEIETHNNTRMFAEKQRHPNYPENKSTVYDFKGIIRKVH